MLRRLCVRDVVLIEAVDVDFAAGLNVLTGETGAGKSILLDALGLAVGARGDAALVRAGAAAASVVAAFDLPARHGARDALVEAGFAPGDSLVVRRVVQADGRSRAFIDDQPVTVGLLNTVGEALVEVHGQHDQRGLLRPETHRRLLDAFGGHEERLARVAGAYRDWQDAREAETRIGAEAAAREAERAALDATLGELGALDPKPGEDAALAGARTRLAHAQRIAEAVETARAALAGGGGVVDRVRGAERALAKVTEAAAGALDGAAQALERCRIEGAEAMALIEAAARDLAEEPARLDEIERRLFALRALARKLGVAPDDLPATADGLKRRLAALEDDDAAGERLGARTVAAEAALRAAAAALSEARDKAAKGLAKRVATELAPLKLGAATFRVALEARPFEQWSVEGAERVVFQVATNPGAEPGPLHRIASGGELARFMLALKVVLARAAEAATLVFDEVDAGVGGAVADAVGARLARLGHDHQVLVVTHSPQVAAKAGHHLRVVKAARGGRATVSVETLDDTQRAEEIARMLAGASVTAEARAAAVSLLRAGAS